MLLRITFLCENTLFIKIKQKLLAKVDLAPETALGVYSQEGDP